MVRNSVRAAAISARQMPVQSSNLRLVPVVGAASTKLVEQAPTGWVGERGRGIRIACVRLLAGPRDALPAPQELSIAFVTTGPTAGRPPVGHLLMRAPANYCDCSGVVTISRVPEKPVLTRSRRPARIARRQTGRLLCYYATLASSRPLWRPAVS
jgi:hypothetical protein